MFFVKHKYSRSQSFLQI